MRTCIGCRRRDDRSVLLRVVSLIDELSGSAMVQPDPHRRLPGRGAWLHPTTECVRSAERRRAYGRALRLTGPYEAGAVLAYVEPRA